MTLDLAIQKILVTLEDCFEDINNLKIWKVKMLVNEKQIEKRL